MTTTHADSVILNNRDDKLLEAGGNVPVRVNISGSQSFAKIFDRKGNALTNPFNADQNGNYIFDVADGTYDIVVNQGQPSEYTLPNLKIGGEVDTDFDNIKEEVVGLSLVEGLQISCARYHAGGELVGGLNYYIKTVTKAVADGDIVDDLINHTLDNGNIAVLVPGDYIDAKQCGALGDSSTDSTPNIQAALNGFSANIGGLIKIPPDVRFNSTLLNFPKRSTLQYFAGSDTGPKAGPITATNELVTMHNNANDGGIVNEDRDVGAFHIAHGLELRKDLTGHDSFLGAGQTKKSPARMSYNMFDEGYDRWRLVYEFFDERTPFSGVTQHMWIQRVTLDGVGLDSFTVDPIQDDRVQGVTSGAVGLIQEITSTQMVLRWVSGTFVVGENVINNRGTVASPLNEASSTVVTNVSHETNRTIGLSVSDKEGYWGVGLPPQSAKNPLTVGGKVGVTQTRDFGQYQPEMITDPSFVLVDSYELTTPNGFEITYDTAPSAANRRLVLRKLGASDNLANIGATKAYTGFTDSAVPATSSFNVSGVTRNGTGDYTVTFAVPFARADYQVSFGAGSPLDKAYTFSKSTTELSIRNVTAGTSTLADLSGVLDVTVCGGDI